MAGVSSVLVNRCLSVDRVDSGKRSWSWTIDIPVERAGSFHISMLSSSSVCVKSLIYIL